MFIRASFAGAIVVLGFAGAAASAQQTAAGTWVEVMRDPRGPVFVDSSSLQRNGQIVILRSRTDLVEVTEQGAKTMFVRFQYDCRARTADLLGIHFFKEDGSTLVQLEVEPAERRVEPVPAGTPNAAIMDRYCR